MPFVYSTSIFFICLLLLLIFNMLYRRQQFSTSNRWFLLLAITMISVLLLEMLSWVYDGDSRDIGFLLIKPINLAFYISNLCVPVLWLIYLDYKIFSSLERLRRRLYYSPFLILGIIVLLINLKTEWIYSIDSNNFFQRNQLGTVLFTAYIFVLIYIPLLFLRNHKEKRDRNILIAILFFTLFPLLGALIQILTYQPMIVWNAVSLALVAIYIFLELNTLSRDQLTGLESRKQMEEWLSYRCQQVNHGKKSFGLIMIDLDGFKSINDNWGHQEGDEALIIFANLLNQSFKRTDLISRFAGDEFLVALEADDPVLVQAIIERFQLKLKEFNHKSLKKYKILCSMGVVIFDPQIHKHSIGLLNAADQMMYKEKEKRKISENLSR